MNLNLEWASTPSFHIEYFELGILGLTSYLLNSEGNKILFLDFLENHGLENLSPHQQVILNSKTLAFTNYSVYNR